MNTYSFTIFIDMTEMTDEALDRLYEAGCDDGGVGGSNGLYSIDFNREANSLASAVQSAVNDIRKAGFRATKIETEESATIQSLNQQLVSIS